LNKVIIILFKLIQGQVED